MKKRIAAAALAASALAAAVVVLPALAATPTLKGVVGPGFTISMAKKPVKAGKYRLVVADKSSFHNFHLKGPGVNVKTGVPFTGTKAFRITLKKGRYVFLCDPHATTMRGAFTIR